MINGNLLGVCTALEITAAKQGSCNVHEAFAIGSEMHDLIMGKIDKWNSDDSGQLFTTYKSAGSAFNQFRNKMQSGDPVTETEMASALNAYAEQARTVLLMLRSPSGNALPGARELLSHRIVIDT